MNLPLPLPKISWLLAFGLFQGLVLIAHPAENGDITAVSSRVSDDYIRAKLASGAPAPETYAFGEGGHWSGIMKDETIDELKFTQIAKTLAVPLAGKNYLPSRDPDRTKLLIMVYWGTTTGWNDDPNSLTAETVEEKMQFSQIRERTDAKNAAMLGYDSEDVIGTDYGRGLLLTAMHQHTDDLIDEIEDNRYFVVLMAYDFQLLRSTKQHKLLWETRFSIRERSNDFGQVLPDMAQYASRYFGQDTRGLIRKPLPETSVKLGDIKYLGDEPEKK